MPHVIRRKDTGKYYKGTFSFGYRRRPYSTHSSNWKDTMEEARVIPLERTAKSNATRLHNAINLDENRRLVNDEDLIPIEVVRIKYVENGIVT